MTTLDRQLNGAAWKWKLTPTHEADRTGDPCLPYPTHPLVSVLPTGTHRFPPPRPHFCAKSSLHLFGSCALSHHTASWWFPASCVTLSFFGLQYFKNTLDDTKRDENLHRNASYNEVMILLTKKRLKIKFLKKTERNLTEDSWDTG